MPATLLLSRAWPAPTPSGTRRTRAVGLSLAMLQVDLLIPSIVIGIVAVGMTLTGMLLGRRLQSVWGNRAELLGGLVMIAIGVRVLITHLIG